MAASGQNVRARVMRPLHAITKVSAVYPINGFFYFLSHPYAYPLLRTRLLPCALLSLFVFSQLFFWTYLPQVAFLAIFQHPRAAAWVNGTFLVLGEGAAIVAILFEAFFVDETQVDMFDSVLIDKGLVDLVEQSRPVASVDEAGHSPLRRLGRPRRSAVYAPFSLRQIVEFIIFLPLNFIPFVGVPAFLLLTGYRAGPLQHWRYFHLKGLNKKQRKMFIEVWRLNYTWFGTVHLLLQLIPVLSMLFLITTSAGAALWAADLEKEMRIEEEERRQSEDPPEYTEYADDPV